MTYKVILGMRRTFLAIACLAVVVMDGSVVALAQIPPGVTLDSVDQTPYLVRRAAFHTKLRRKGPASQGWPKETPEGVHEVSYRSGGLRLKAWVHIPPAKESGGNRAVVYFHGGFALNAGDVVRCKPFMDAGFVVMMPTLRGENGNPGIFEMFLGEVDDAAAAVDWLSQQPYVDPRRVYTFGHSAGGIVSAMLSLFDALPIQHGGSSGGLYSTDLFARIRNRVPFDRSDPIESQLRVLPGNIAWMKRKHYAFIGKSDVAVLPGVAAAKKEIAGTQSNLKIIMHEGNHNSALRPAMQQYVQLILSER